MAPSPQGTRPRTGKKGNYLRKTKEIEKKERRDRGEGNQTATKKTHKILAKKLHLSCTSKYEEREQRPRAGASAYCGKEDKNRTSCSRVLLKFS